MRWYGEMNIKIDPFYIQARLIKVSPPPVWNSHK